MRGVSRSMISSVNGRESSARAIWALCAQGQPSAGVRYQPLLLSDFFCIQTWHEDMSRVSYVWNHHDDANGKEIRLQMSYDLYIALFLGRSRLGGRWCDRLR